MTDSPGAHTVGNRAGGVGGRERAIAPADTALSTDGWLDRSGGVPHITSLVTAGRGVVQQNVFQFEKSEVNDRIQLRTLRHAANAVNCADGSLAVDHR